MSRTIEISSFRGSEQVTVGRITVADGSFVYEGDASALRNLVDEYQGYRPDHSPEQILDDIYEHIRRGTYTSVREIR